MKISPCFLRVLAILFVITAVSVAEQKTVPTQSGLEYLDLEAGTGVTAEFGRIAVIHFVGWLDENGQRGKQIINSRDRREPVAFKLGTDRVMKGWNIGVIGMKVGGMRRLMIPAELAYGARGVDDLIPPDANLIFDIELLEVK